LVVEDDALIRLMIVDYLKDLDCVVVATASVLPDALQKASSLAFDVGLLDINLKGTLSYPVGEVLAARHIPFLFCTAYSAAALPAELSSTPVLMKPFNMHQLADQLQIAIGGVSP